MKRHTFLASCIFAVACSAPFVKMMVSAHIGNSQLASESAKAAKRVVVKAAGRGNPYISFEDRIELSTSYTGAPAMQSLLKANAAEPRALASADFDEDGVPDLICGYARAGGGIITMYRGNVDSIFPNSPEAQGRRTEGAFTDSAFLSPARVFEAPAACDFVGAGDFDADGHWDVVIAARGDRELWMFPGDGKGNFLAPRKIALAGAATSLITGEINRADGLTDIVVGVVADEGPKALVFEGPEGALRANPEVFALPGEPKALALGQFDDDYSLDLAVGAGFELVIIHGRDRKLWLDEIRQAEVLPARLDRRAFGFEIQSIAAGDFNGTNETNLALLASDGTVRLTSAQKVADKRAAKKKADPEVFAQWPGAAQLFCARVSTGPADDLVILNRNDRSLQIQKTGLAAPSISAPSSSVRADASLDFDGAPSAVLPMRLNGDALSDLVVLQNRSSAPAILKTKAAQTFTVNKADDHDDGVCDSGDCTLREAINAANANAGADTIIFAIGSGVQTIALSTDLPIIADPVSIDGSSQPGFAGSPIIELNGTNARVRGGLTITGGTSVVRSLVLNRFNNLAIGLSGTGGNRLEGSFIGTDVTGSTSLLNSLGIGIARVSGNTVGGTVPAARNIISGNNLGGIEIEPFGSSGNNIQGNYIGTNAAGTGALGNRNNFGVSSGGGTGGDTIGGTAPGAGNVISANSSVGIELGGVGYLVQGNLIGTNASGTAALPNSETGISFESAPGTTIGGTVRSARNVISGNASSGIKVFDSNGVLVQGNFIGTASDGITPLPNSTFGTGNSRGGIFIRSGSDNAIGGTTSGAGNLIAFNGTAGLLVISGRRNSVRRNSIFSNDGPAIDLIGHTGSDANDPCDADAGANDLQNFPVLTSAVSNGASTTIQGTLNSTANTAFTIEFFANDACDPSGFGEGQTFTGSATVTTDGSCNANFSVTLSVSVRAGQVITATAADPAGNTSEFSQCAQVQPAFDLCLQDESNGNILLLNSITGNYQFTNCRGLTLTGVGSLLTKGCLVTLQVNGPDRRILARIDTCLKSGTASVQVLSQGTTFTILDRNTANNTCVCAGPG
jgi:CSLREA domain-containing protein